MQGASYRWIQDLIDQSTLPGPGDSCDGDEQSKREIDANVLEVVLACTGYRHFLTVAAPSLDWHWDFERATQVASGAALPRSANVLRCSGSNDLPTTPT